MDFLKVVGESIGYSVFGLILAVFVIFPIATLQVPETTARGLISIDPDPIEADILYTRMLGTRYGAYTVFTLRNIGESPIHYDGYSESYPTYELQRLDRTVGWKKVRLGWCGNGLRRRDLEPGQVVELLVHERFPEPWRLGVTFINTSGTVSKTIWSDPVRFSVAFGT